MKKRNPDPQLSIIFLTPLFTGVVEALRLEKEAVVMTEHYKNLGQNLDKERVKHYLAGIMRNEKLFQALEGEKKE